MASWSALFDSYKEECVKPQNNDAGIKFLLNKITENLGLLSNKTNRNTILYYSAFLNKNSIDNTINDKDINAFMSNVYQLDKSKGLDLILHTPGGDVAATEQIIKYLNMVFQDDIRAIVPQMAMSGGSLIAVSCKSIMMGKESSLGPFDPQLGGVACQSMIKEFSRAQDDVARNPHNIGLWQPILSKLNPTFITQCEQSVALCNELATNLLASSDYSETTKERIKKKFLDNSDSKTHNRHFDINTCKEVGLHIEDLESDPEIQDIVLTIHHCYTILGEQSTLVKIVENNLGKGYFISSKPAQ